MKNIKYPLILLMQLLVFQLVAQDQAVLNNGRASTATAQTVGNTDDTKKSPTDDLNRIDDADIEGTYYLGGSSEEDVIVGDRNPADLLNRLDNLEAELQALRLSNEQLSNENQTMKMEMSSCCSEAAANMNLTGSYLLQNSPNPFQADTNIKFYIADVTENAQLEIRNIEGVLLQSYNLDQRGIGELRLDQHTFNKGTYVYTLSVDGKIVDSKVMILQ